ncbi:MAG: SusC/RagA family TonB-linked outer membrane protein [Cytophagaceae bacterium]|nr:SusC/RagA family TonB-linked outer membrane protein [Cytophagaceae bacterium]
MKQLLPILLLLGLPLAPLFAQDRLVSGRVLSGEDGAGLPGASVLLKGTNTGTSTDAEGRFRLSVPTSGKLLVTFIGFVTQEVAPGNQTTLDITLKADANQLSEVVVTAFGIEKEKKALGYSQQSLSSKAIADVRPANVANALSGKIAGVRINSNSGPGGGSTIQIRGASSISSNNQPLIVIDGVPIEQNFNKQFGSGISEVNPENIKDISVLKGPNAAALYGSRAANGVILITTKNGSGTKGIGVEVSTNFTAERPFISPNSQNSYGGGNGYRTWYNDGWSGGITDPAEIAQYRAAYGPSAPLTGTDGTDESWGAPLDGRLVRHWYSGKEVAPLTPQPNNFQEFWQTGSTWTNNIAVSGGNDKGFFRLGLGRLDQKGIMYFNDYRRNNYKLNAGYNFTPKLSVTMSGEYIKSGSGNRSYVSGQEFIWSHRHVSWDQLRDWKSYVGTHIQRALPGRSADTDPPNWQHTFFTNPYFIQAKLPSSDDKDRLVGNLALTYKILPELSVMLRSGTDVFTQTFINVINFERVRNGNRTFGQYSEQIVRRQETNTDVILTFNKALTRNFSVNAQAGAVQRTNYFKDNFMRVGQLVVDGLYNLGNAVPSQNQISSTIQKKETQSVFGALNLSWRNAVFLDVTARNDWSSTLPADNRSYFYPSASLSTVITDLVPGIKNDILTFGKVRASWAKVGNDTDPYQLAQNFPASTNSWSGSQPQFYENTTIANSQLKPETTTGLEFGVDVRLFKGKVGIDATYYEQDTRNQILGVDISKASGYNRRILNAGQITNKGFEVTISGTPVKLGNGFQWDVAFNFARNRNKVIELAEGLTTYTLNERRGLTLEARAGQSYGTLYGYGFARVQSADAELPYYDATGQFKGQLVLGANGLPIRDNNQKILGNIQPDWIGGFTNSFSYKGISLTALIDAKIGGDMYDEGTANARWTGQYAETAIGREEGVIGQGVNALLKPDGSYQFTKNSVIASANAYTGYNNPRTYHEAAIFDASYVKLREVSLGYQLPGTLIKRLGLQSARLAVVGRNVAMLFKNHPHQDPEIDANGSNRQGFGYGELPSSRSLGFNLNLGF